MNDDQLLRYSRHIMLEGFDYAGQQALLDAKVLVVGVGGLGCPIALYLAASGVGELHLADGDTVEMSNLQRQIAHNMASVGRAKVDSGADAIAAINPDIHVVTLTDKLSGEALRSAVAAVDVVVDASDNFSTRFALNRACVEFRKPLVSGAAIRAEGQVIVFDSRRPDSPCYRCLYDDAVSDSNLSCSESGVLAPLVGVIGTMQALETLKLISGFGESRVGQLLVFDGWSSQWRQLKVNRDPACPVCSGR